MIRCCAGGHSIPKAGSSQRTPLADSGTYSCDIWYATSVSSTSVW